MVLIGNFRVARSGRLLHFTEEWVILIELILVAEA